MPRRRQRHTAAGPVEQARPEFLLQGLDGLRDRRLRDAESIPGRADALLFGDGEEVAQLLKLDCALLPGGLQAKGLRDDAALDLVGTTVDAGDASVCIHPGDLELAHEAVTTV